MPLSCMSPDGREYAFCHDAASWESLAARNRKESHLSAECCGHRVVLKRSPLGTQFFAHRRRGACNFQPESREHLLAKDTIARAALSIGWNAETEARSLERVPEWIADVLCSRSDRSSRVAFEVQWTRQTLQESERRQVAYKASGVRAMWLMRQADVPVSRDVPAFRLVFVPEASQFQVWLPSGHHPSVYEWRSKDNDRDWAQKVELATFVRGALNGALKFAPMVDQVVPVSVELVGATCWKCHASIRLLRSFVVRSENRWKGFEGFSFGVGEFETGNPNWEEWIHEHLPPARLAALGAGEIKRRYSKTMADRYLSNGCMHCGALQGRFFEHEHAFEESISLDVEMKVTSNLLESSGNVRAARRWWFDEDYPVVGSLEQTTKV